MAGMTRTWVAVAAATATTLAVPACGAAHPGAVKRLFSAHVTVGNSPANVGMAIDAGQAVRTDPTGQVQFTADKLTCRQNYSTKVIVEPGSGVLLHYVNGSTVTCATSRSGPCSPKCNVDALHHTQVTMTDPVFTVVGSGNKVTVRVAAGSLTVSSTKVPGSVTLHAGQQVITVDGQRPGTPTYFDLAALSAFERQAFHDLRSTDPEAHLSATATAVPSQQSFTCGSPRPAFSSTGQISSDQPTTLTYRWRRSNGTLSGLYSMIFTGPGTQQARGDTWTPPTDNYQGTDTLRVSGVSGASASSEPSPITLTCIRAPAAILSNTLTSFTPTTGAMVSATWHVTTDSSAAFTFTAEFAQTSDPRLDITKDHNYYAAPSITESGQTIYDITVTWQYNPCLTDPYLVTSGTATGTGTLTTSPRVTKKTGTCVTPPA